MSRRSTLTNLVSFTQYISNTFNNSGQVDVIYTDFSKAFDKLDHGLLLKKLCSIGLDRNLLSLFHSYLTDRCLVVHYQGFKSVQITSTSGVPQGSILGPLLFTIFINDICQTINCRLLLYADDCKLFSRVDNLLDCKLIQNDLHAIKRWCDENCLPLNINKCKCMSFSRKKELIEFHYEIDNILLEKCVTFKDLGVTFDSKLSFVYHVSMVTAAAYKNLGFIIRNTKFFSDINSLKLLFNAFVRSKLEYASIVWSPGYDQHISSIEQVQRRFLKHLSFKLDQRYPDRGIPHSPLLLRFGLNSLSARRDFAGVVFLYKLLNNELDSPTLLSNINVHVPVVNTRTNNTFYLARPSSNALLFSPIFRICSIYMKFQKVVDIFCCNVACIKKVILDLV